MGNRDREHHIVVWGATGFTGRLVAEYLANHAPADVRFALGGRDRNKLEAMRKALPGRGAEAPIVVHDAASVPSMRELARSTRVVCTTVGPYDCYGMPLVEACSDEGTDYCDLTGEVPFMRRSIDTCDGRARTNKARIVHTCGFDSIPSDLGVFILADTVKHPFSEIRLVLKDMRGGMSGGTIASGLGILDLARKD